MIAGNPAAMGQITRHGRGRMCRCTGSAGASRSGPAGRAGEDQIARWREENWLVIERH